MNKIIPFEQGDIVKNKVTIIMEEEQPITPPIFPMTETASPLAKEICDMVSEIKPNVLFFIGGVMYISKYDKNGIWTTKRAMRDPKYNGNRYVWEDEVYNSKRLID